MKLIFQFKLASGDEIICEVITWNDEDTDAIVIKGALVIDQRYDEESNLIYFNFSPYIAMNNHPDTLCMLNSNLIAMTMKVTDSDIVTYFDCIEKLKKNIEQNSKETIKPTWH